MLLGQEAAGSGGETGEGTGGGRGVEVGPSPDGHQSSAILSGIPYQLPSPRRLLMAVLLPNRESRGTPLVL